MVDSIWIKFVACILMFSRVNGLLQVPITYVEDAVAKGAVCLDGSPAAYHFDKGFGTGVHNWLIHLEGGGTCPTADDCYERSKHELGSSHLMTKNYTFEGILSNEAKYNPYFYNWNRIKLRYCDGSCFTGDIEEVDSNKKLYYRGARIWRAVMDDLLAKGLKNARHAILGGCSSGGVSIIIHCDDFRSLLPSRTKVKCISDAGFMINAKDITGKPRIEEMIGQVIATHGSVKTLNAECISKFGPVLCFFPPYAARFIKTPLFLLNSAYDPREIIVILAPKSVDPNGEWNVCKADITKCSESQIQILHDYRKQFLTALKSLGRSQTRGYFIDSCFVHCQSETQETWLRDDSPLLHNTTIAEAIGEWFFDWKKFRAIDCPYPCDKTCHNRVIRMETTGIQIM